MKRPHVRICRTPPLPLGLALTASLCFGALPLQGASRFQDPPKTSPPAQVDPQGDPAQVMVQMLAEHGVTLDPKAKTVAIDGVINRRSDPLEYVLIHRRGKGHEAMLVTEVKASWLNAALLALGYKPGTNASTKEKDPLPSEEEMRKGAAIYDVVPPQGQRIYMTVSFEQPPPPKPEGEEQATDAPAEPKSGKPVIVSYAIEDLLMDLHTGAPVTDAEFLYLGGRMGPINRGDPDVFLADYEGNLVSSCYMLPGNQLATIRHERAGDERNWWFTDFVPPTGTKVRITFHKNQPKEYEGREARAREIAKRVAREWEEYEREQARKEKEEQEKQGGTKPPDKQGEKR